MKNSGQIIVMAFPDTFVKMSEEFICKVLPLVGLGTREYIKAGHAALVLVHNETEKRITTILDAMLPQKDLVVFEGLLLMLN